MFCTQCGSQLSENAKFCMNCGASVAVSRHHYARATRIAAFDFQSDIQRLTQNFVGREWFFEEVDRWLATAQPRVMLLTANPGVGKSAIAARLTEVRASNLLAYHFCTSRDSGTIVPNRILRALAAQFIETLPGYGEALANTIDVYRNEINVNIRVETQLGGKIVGVHIENLVAGNPHEVLDILLRQPLLQLTPPAQPTFILIDSLDEAVTYSGGEHLPQLLSKVADLPPWVRLLCTTRPDRRVLRYFDALDPYLLAAESQENLADMTRYIAMRVADAPMVSRLQEAQLDVTTFRDRVAELAQGNFLYTQVLLDDIAAGRQLLDDLATLPHSLDEIYHQFFTRFSFEAWRTRYHPLFSVLAVARQPIRRDHLVHFTGISATILRQELGVIQQFLTITENVHGERSYTLFHQSIRDYLLDEERNWDFWCAPQDCHALITRYYLTHYHDQWDNADNDGYLFAHLVYHLEALAADDADAAQALATLFDTPRWLHARVQSDDGYDGFLADIALARHATRGRHDTTAIRTKGHKRFTPPTGLARLIHYALLQATVHSLIYHIPPALLARLVELGIWSADRALDLAAQEQEAAVQVDHFRSLLATGKLSALQVETANEGLANATTRLDDTTTLPDLSTVPSPGAVAWNLNGATLHALEEALISVLTTPDAKRGYSYQLISEEAHNGYLAALTTHHQQEQTDPLQALLSQPKQPRVEHPFDTTLREAHDQLSQEMWAKLRIVPRATTSPYITRQQSWEVGFAQSMALAFTPKVAERYSAQALSQTLQQKEQSARLLALAGLIPHVDANYLEEVAAATLAIDGVQQRNGLLSKLAPRITAAHLRRIVQELNAIHEDEAQRLTLLATLIPDLTIEVQERTLTFVQQWNSKWPSQRTAALAPIASLLPADERQALLRDAQQALSETNVQALAALCPTLSAEQQHGVAKAMVERPYDEEREIYLNPILIKLGDYLDDAYFLYWIEPAQFYSSSTKGLICNQLQSAATAQEQRVARSAALLQVALGRESSALIIDSLRALAGRLTAEQAQYALPIITQLDHIGWRTAGQILLATDLPSNERDTHLTAAVATIPNLGNHAQSLCLGLLGQFHPPWAEAQSDQLQRLLINLLERVATDGRSTLLVHLTNLYPLWRLLTPQQTSDAVAQSLFAIGWDWVWP